MRVQRQTIAEALVVVFVLNLVVMGAVPWLGVTGVAASVGLRRLSSRGVRPLPDLAVDPALLYVPVGAVALLLHRAGISLRFEPVIALLTVVHYAGFVLPLVTGLAGRRLAGGDGRFGTDIAGRTGAAATLVIVVNLALIAVGITFSPLVEVVAVALFTAAVTAFALLVLRGVAPSLPPLPRALLSVASLTLVVRMIGPGTLGSRSSARTAHTRGSSTGPPIDSPGWAMWRAGTLFSVT